MAETAFDIIDGVCWVSTDQRAIINRIEKLMEQTGEGCCKLKPEENDGCWYGTIPASWVRIGLPRKLQLTDEQKAERAERLRAAREGCFG